jgi:hypothetical protein
VIPDDRSDQRGGVDRLAQSAPGVTGVTGGKYWQRAS